MILTSGYGTHCTVSGILYTTTKIISMNLRAKGLYCIFLLITFFPVKLAAQGNLLITPGRVVFDGQKRMQELNMANAGKDTARYIISFIEIKMNRDGTFEQITQPEPGQYFASNNLRFFPRSIKLAPNESQVVKLQLVKNSQMAPGEYRSHIYFRAVPEEIPLGEKTPGKDSFGISVTLRPIFGISIPVIIRVGENNADVSISDVAMAMEENIHPVLSMILNRTGNMSVYGDLKIDLISPNGKVTQVGDIKGIAVYTPTSNRSMRVMLSKIAGIDYKSGKLHITYTTRSTAGPMKTTETELALF